MPAASIDVNPLLDPRAVDRETAESPPLVALVSFLAAHEALLTDVDVEYDSKIRGVVRKIAVHTKMPLATDPLVYAPMTNAGFRIDATKTLSFVTSGELAQNVSLAVLGWWRESKEMRHAHIVLRSVHPAALRLRTAKSVVATLQALLGTERWFELGVMHNRRVQAQHWRLPTKFGDMAPVVNRVRESDSLTAMLAFLFVYGYYIEGYGFSTIGGATYCNMSLEGRDEFISCMGSLKARFREKVDALSKTAKESDTPYEV